MMLFPVKMIMANDPAVSTYAKAFLESHNVRPNSPVPLYVLKSLISSPRLFDVYWDDFNSANCAIAGDTFLDRFTMLADSKQKTYAISFEQWNILRGNHKDHQDFDAGNRDVLKIQVWPFEPQSLSAEQMLLAVAVSYSDVELLDEPRLCGALNMLLSDYNVECYWENRIYG